MKRKLAIVSIAVAGCLASATTIWATSYTFTFSGADLMDYELASAKKGTTPADIKMYDGARRYTFDTDDGTGSWSSWLKGTKNLFENWADTTKSRMTSFNLWGYGDIQNQFGESNATEWGEKYLVNSWVDTGKANKNWESIIYFDEGTLGKEVLTFYSGTGYDDALKFDAKKYPTYSFTIDLDPDSTLWKNGKEGVLTFWFGGLMVDDNDDDMGTLQGNMVLKGVANPVPEPATMLLFGAGLSGLAFIGKKSRKNKG